MPGTYPTPAAAADVAELQQGEFYVPFNVMHVCYLFPFSGKKDSLLLDVPTHL